jgi:membrane associated rhomboid family serine protease
MNKLRFLTSLLIWIFIGIAAFSISENNFISVGGSMFIGGMLGGIFLMLSLER